MLALLILFANTHSLSMGADFAATPTIKVQEWWPFSSLRIGDVICFKPSKDTADYYAYFEYMGYKKTVCHRIIWRNNNFALTKGDNNKYMDRGFVLPNQYLGRVQ